jgi:hypothetical protein
MKLTRIIFNGLVLLLLQLHSYCQSNKVSVTLQIEPYGNDRKFVVTVTNNTKDKIYFDAFDIEYKIFKNNKDFTVGWVSHSLHRVDTLSLKDIRHCRGRIPDKLQSHVSLLKDSLLVHLEGLGINFENYENKKHFFEDIIYDLTENLIFLDPNDSFIFDMPVININYPKGLYKVYVYFKQTKRVEFIGSNKTYKVSTPKCINDYFKYKKRVKSKTIFFKIE